eukprot:gene1926-33336_t
MKRNTEAMKKFGVPDAKLILRQVAMKKALDNACNKKPLPAPRGPLLGPVPTQPTARLTTDAPQVAGVWMMDVLTDREINDDHDVDDNGIMAGNQDAQAAEGEYRDCYDKWIVALSDEGFKRKDNIDILADELADGEFKPDCQVFKAIIAQGGAEGFIEGLHVLGSMMPTCDMWVAVAFMKRILGVTRQAGIHPEYTTPDCHHWTPGYVNRSAP